MKIIARTKKALMMMTCFLAARRNGNASHCFGHVQLDHHRGGILVSLPTGVLEDVELLGFYDVLRLAEYDQVLCSLAVWRSQETDWSRYGCNDPQLFGHKSSTGLVYGIMPLRANKRSNTGSSIVLSIPGHEVSCCNTFSSQASHAARLSELTTARPWDQVVVLKLLSLISKF